MSKPVKAVPEGFHSLTPALTVRGGGEAIDFYQRAFGAVELLRMPGPDGKTVMHAELKIGDSIFFVSDEYPQMGTRSPLSLGGSAGSLNLYVDDVDMVFNRAVAAGATVSMPISDMFWGDRYGKLRDPFGHEWGIGTHKEDLSPGELERRAHDAFKQWAAAGGAGA